MNINDELVNFSLQITAKQGIFLLDQGIFLYRNDWGRHTWKTPGAGTVGAGRIRVSGETFEPVEQDQPKGADGNDQVVEGVIHGIWQGFASPELVDLVAWCPQEPEIWWRRKGVATWLGEAALLRAQGLALEEPDQWLRLCRTPLSWLRAVTRGEAATCLLDAGGRLLRDLLFEIRAIIPDDEPHAAELYKALRRRTPAPRIPDVLQPGKKVAA